MLVGTALGIFIMLLALVILFLIGKCAAYAGLNKTLNKELHETQLILGRFVILEQERQKIKENVVINFTEEQITTLANRIGSRCATIHDSEQQAALNKLS
jgi:hypothetical protein